MSLSEDGLRGNTSEDEPEDEHEPDDEPSAGNDFGQLIYRRIRGLHHVAYIDDLGTTGPREEKLEVLTWMSERYMEDGTHRWHPKVTIDEDGIHLDGILIPNTDEGVETMKEICQDDPYDEEITALRSWSASKFTPTVTAENIYDIDHLEKKLRKDTGLHLRPMMHALAIMRFMVTSFAKRMILGKLRHHLLDEIIRACQCTDRMYFLSSTQCRVAQTLYDTIEEVIGTTSYIIKRHHYDDTRVITLQPTGWYLGSTHVTEEILMKIFLALYSESEAELSLHTVEIPFHSSSM